MERCKVIAKKEQIKMIELIMHALCVRELTEEGREHLKRMKRELQYEILLMKSKRDGEEALVKGAARSRFS